MSRVRQITQKELTANEIYEKFILAKQAEGLANRTIEDYKYHLINFFQTTNVNIFNQEQLNEAIQKYFIQSAKLAPITYNTRRKKLITFFTWMKKHQYIQNNPMSEIPKRKEDELPRAIDINTLKELLNLPDLKTYSGIRDFALIILTMDNGIRPSEATHLTIKDFNFKSFEVIIPAHIAKTRISRTLPLRPTSVDAIKKLLSVRHPHWNEQVTVFCTENGTILTRFQWSRRLRQYSEKLNVSVTPYTLRHSFSTIYLKLGGNAFNLQKMLGHTTMTMTRRYVVVSQNDLHNQHEIASPLNILINQKGRVRKV